MVSFAERFCEAHDAGLSAFTLNLNLIGRFGTPGSTCNIAENCHKNLPCEITFNPLNW